MNMNGHSSLDVLKAQRTRLLAKRDAIQKTQRAVDARERLAAATQELADFKAAKAHAVEQWAAQGCRGERPSPDIDRHAELLQQVTAAQQVVDNSADAERLLADKIGDISTELGNVGKQIEQAAVREIADEFTALAEELVALEARRNEIVEALRAGLGWVEQDRNDVSKGNYSADRGQYDRARKIAKDALIAGPGIGFPRPAIIAKWRAKLSSLRA